MWVLSVVRDIAVFLVAAVSPKNPSCYVSRQLQAARDIQRSLNFTFLLPFVCPPFSSVFCVALGVAVFAQSACDSGKIHLVISPTRSASQLR